MLTIDEIKEISFRRGRGYKGEDVDAFIDEVIVTFEQMKKEKSDLIRKMDILATRVEQYRSDEETVRNALLTSQRVADASIKEAKAQAAKIVADAEAQAKAAQKESDTITAKQKEVYLQLQSDSVQLKNELKALYTKHMKIIEDLPTDAALIKAKEELDAKYPTKPVEEPAAAVSEQPEVKAEAAQESAQAAAKTTADYVAVDESKFSNLKFGENYDVEAD